jgi:hypothetical protein
MPAKFVQLDTHESGTAQLQITGPGARRFSDPQAIEIAIVQPGLGERFLDPRDQADPWKLGAFHFRPINPQHNGAGELIFEIDHAVTYHLRAMAPYFVRVRFLSSGLDPAEDAWIQEAFTMPATTRRPSVRPAGWIEPADPNSPASRPVSPTPAASASEAEPLVEEVPSFEAPSLTGLATQPALERKPASRTGLIAALAVLGLVAAGLALWLVSPQTFGPDATPGSALPVPVATPAAAPKAGVPANMDACRQAISAAPQVDQARDWALGMAKEKRLLDCQFLLFRFAAEKGDSVSARSLGVFYDPDTWSRESSPLPSPNPAEASRWHKQAAESGDIESMYRYGMLLKLGRTGIEGEQAQKLAQEFLTRARDAGHPQAAAALQ